MPDENPKGQTADAISQVLTQLTRVGFAIDKELTLISERMSWLVISESFIFSAYTVAMANMEKSRTLGLLAWGMPVVGLLLALLVYPALLAADNAARRLKKVRQQFEQKLPEDLQLNLLATDREYFWGSIPAFVIPVMLILVWALIIVVQAIMPWTAN